MPLTPINQIELSYSPDSTLLFASIRARPYPVFLDSSGYGGKFGRFDILCADPTQLLIHQDSQTLLIQQDGKTEKLSQPPFSALQQLLLKQGFDAISSPELPFCGGAMGYFGYDLGRCYVPLASHAEDDITLPQMQVGIYPWSIIVDHQKHKTTLASHSLTVSQLRTLADSFSPLQPKAFRLDSPFQANMDRDGYLKRFLRVIDYIHAGDCYQVNLAQRFSCDYQGDPWSAYLKLRKQTNTPFSAYMESPQGCLLSLSPERFLQVADGQVETRPIKGTRPRHPQQDKDLKLKTELETSTKDRAENLMIVDLLRNDLGRSCSTGSVKVPELFKIESYANVHHLVSAITGTLDNPIEVIDLLQGCFPGGSITGAPKIRAMQIIEELEPHRRSAYCGAIGYIGFNGQMDSNICIRTLVATRDNATDRTHIDRDHDKHKGKLHCWAGGGIVADSNGDAEYQETFDKVNNLIRCLEDEFFSTTESPVVS